VAAGLPLSFLDLHGNQFACPLPAFPVSPPLVVLRSPPQCQYSVADILAYIGIGAGVSVGAALLAIVVKYVVSSQQFLLASFAFWWIASATGFVSNALSYSNTFAYLRLDSQNCPTMNEYRVFGALMPVIPNVKNASTPPGLPFSIWIADPLTGFKDTDIWINSNVFAALCARVPECAYQARW
jgi:hypothetical protein